MATASEFRLVARVLDDARLELDDLAALLRRLVDGVALAGPARTAADATVGVSIANVGSIVADLEHHAAEARHRAAVCDAYTEAYRRFLQSHDPNPVPPRRPAPWVRYG